jgi:hypothetical protein
VPTYYDVLGVPVNAAPEELRRAYLAMARELHPDRTLGMSKDEAELTSRRMQHVNEAWRILKEPASRAAYDRALMSAGVRIPKVAPGRPPVAAPDDDDDDLDRPFAHTPAQPGDIGVSIARTLPWLAVAVILAAIFVFTAFAGGERGDPGPGARVGQCISPGSGSDVVPVPCEGPNDGKVVRVVSASSACPSGSTARQAGASWLCLEPAEPLPTFDFATTTTSTA